MLNNIIKFSIKNRIFILITSVVLTIAGVYTTQRMDVDVFPDLNAPTVTVMTEAKGLAPEEVERVVNFPLETALNGATGVRRVRSSATTGFSVVWVEFDWGMDIYRARQIVSEKLSTLVDAFPASVGTPTMGPQSSILGEMYIVALTSPKGEVSMEELRTLGDWTFRPRLMSVQGVAQATVIGGDIKEYQILFSPEKMNYHGVTLDELLDATREFNENSTGGILYQWGNEYIVRGLVSTTHTEDIARCVVKSVDGYPVTIGDIATVKTGGKSPILGLASEKTVPAVLVTITKQPATNTIELTSRLDAAVDEISSKLPDGVHVSTDIFRQADFINHSINNIQRALIEGALFVVIVLFLFLMNGRTTIISLVALPLSLLVAILVMHMMGLTINTMSLGGMAIAIGSLVDDAIIDVENVYKRLKENHLLPPEERKGTLNVIYDASVEIRSSIVSATIITITAFIPLFFLSGMEGRMLIPLGIAFIVSLAASMVVAMTITPVLCYFLLKGEKSMKRSEKESPVSAFVKKWYEKALVWALHHKRICMGTMATVLILAVCIMTQLGRSFLPAFNEGSLSIGTSTLPGIDIHQNDSIGRIIEKKLLTIPEVKTVSRKTGRGELDEHALGANASELEVPFELKDRSRAEFFAHVRHTLSDIPGVAIEVGQPISHRIDAMLSGTSANIAIKIFGDDLNTMYRIGQDIQKKISGVEGIADVNLEPQIERAQLTIVPRRDMLAKYGIAMSHFKEYIDIALAGRVVSNVYQGSRVYDITVKADDASRSTMENIASMYIDTPMGKVTLDQICEVRSTAGPNTISRENVRRKIVLSANVADGDLGGAVKEIQEIVNTQVSMPEGYHVEYGGQFESERQASRTLMLTSIFSLLVIFMMLYQQFKNLKISSLIMLNMPFALIGGVLAIWLTSGIISIPAIIGFISLFGIATRNGILLVSRYGQLQEEGASLYDAVLHGSLDRLNPILMTALTSALALIPLAIGGDLPGNEIQSPMAKVILGGLLSSTLLNGFIIPIVYIWTQKNRKEKCVKSIQLS
ncbi:MAG: efflux RND transporter permease subunit [Flavobacteriales bacterium]|nr:efflux RND transporter permease subunit [Flavobacteriales bacterium]